MRWDTEYYGKVFTKTEVELNGDKGPGNRPRGDQHGRHYRHAVIRAVKTRMPSINMKKRCGHHQRRRHPCRP